MSFVGPRGRHGCGVARNDDGRCAGYPNRQIAQLLGAQFQRFCPRVLGKSDILMSGEAVEGFDRPGPSQFYCQIKDVRRNVRCAILMVNHALHVVKNVSFF
ncbi:MAG: zinc transport system ATP-binding protein [Yoonia sp.]|jgi:zinc transport system ATP-binding protein